MGDAMFERANTLPFGNVDKAIMQDPTVAPMAKLIYAYLTTYAAGARQAFPSKATIARDLGVDRRTVDRGMEKLAESGVVEVRRRRSERGDWTSNLYVIHDFGPRFAGTGTDGGTGKNAPTPPGMDAGTLPAQMSHEEDKGRTPGEEHQKGISTDALFDLPGLDKSGDEIPAGIPPDGPTFEDFWQAYPPDRRVAKKNAEKAWLKALFGVPAAARGALAHTIVDGAKRYAKERADEPVKFTKHPATWLNGGCWVDAPGANKTGSTYRPYRDEDMYPGAEPWFKPEDLVD